MHSVECDVLLSSCRHVPPILVDPAFWLNVFIAAEWCVRLAMVVIVPFRRSPEAAKGWLLLIFFEPAAGLLLYLLIGRPRLPDWRAQRSAEFDELSKPTYARLARDPNIFHPDVGAGLDHAVRLAENLGELPILGGNDALLPTTTAPSTSSSQTSMRPAITSTSCITFSATTRRRRASSRPWAAP